MMLWLYKLWLYSSYVVSGRLWLKSSQLKIPFKTEKENWNLNYLERLSF